MKQAIAATYHVENMNERKSEVDEDGMWGIIYRPHRALVVTKQPRQEALLVWNDGGDCDRIGLFQVWETNDFESGTRANARTLLYKEVLDSAEWVKLPACPTGDPRLFLGAVVTDMDEVTGR